MEFARSGPWLVTVIRTRMSSGDALGIFHRHIEVAVVSEHAGVHQLEFRAVLVAPAVLFHQLRVGKCGLRVLVQVLHVGVRGRAVQVVVALLDVLAMIALVAGQAEEAFFQDRIAAVPQRDGEADVLVAVADARDAIFIPAIGAAIARDRAENTPRRCRTGCSPRGPFPRRAR